MIEKLTTTQTNILLSLAKYKFLTTSQMVRLGIATQRSNIATSLSKLKAMHKPFIEQMNFGFFPGKGRVENFYYLKPKAKKALIEEMDIEEEKINTPIGTSTMFSSDYFHRKYTIDCHIAIEMSAKENGCEVLFFDRYFDKIGSNRKGGLSRAKTKIDLENGRYLIADGIFMLQTPKQKELYCLEMYNGKDTGRTYKQLKQYIEALVLGSPSIKYNFDRGNRILCVFEHESIMQAVMERLRSDSDFTNMKDYFLFKEYVKMVENINIWENWSNFENENKNLY